ncbi:hypothetical protein J2045_004644 [Peteryoungia aggregata LMG 23059]|uniref:Uncharacterized protein n=1 Tax=Peteryoungia aggregata LMG 23059 TaxID=1368425 RepID=A0ABU0GE00_9HYPH|nr:hypothetical protein [Peteryoungia aggregata LMG 23059]
MPQRHTNKAPALSRTSRQRGETNGGDERRAANGQTIIPRARVPVGLVHHPTGTSRANGQAEASSHGDAAAGPYARSFLGSNPADRRRLARETYAAGIDAERGAGRSHIKLLRQVASGASSETSMTRPGGGNPDRRRSLGFLTVQFHLPPCGGGRKIEGLGERKPPKLQIFLVRGSVLRARRTDPLTCDFRCLGGLRSPNSSKSLSPPPRGRWEPANLTDPLTNKI